MSGTSGYDYCCKCGGQMTVNSDYKPHDYVSGECLECGFSYYTIDEQMTLEEVNDLREDLEMKPIKKLKKQE